MSDIDVKMPDGSVIKFPAGTAPDVMSRVAKEQFAKHPAPTATPAPTQNFTGDLTAAPPIASPNAPNIPVNSPVADTLASAGAGGVQGAQPDYRSITRQPVFDASSSGSGMGAAPVYRDPATGQRVGKGPINALDQFRSDFFNELDPRRFSVPLQAAHALAKNPEDPEWTARVQKMAPIAQIAIRDKAQELAAQPQLDLSQGIGGFGMAPTFRDAIGERTGIPQPHEIIGTMLHGPEGYKQLQEAHGAIPELTRMAEGSLDPENLAFILAAGAIGAAGKAGQAVVKGGIGALMGANAVGKAKQGDIGGAAIDALLAVAPLAEHPISDAVGRVKSKLNNNALSAAEVNPTGRFAPDTPYQIPDINRAPVVDLAAIEADRVKREVDEINARHAAQRAQATPQGELNATTGVMGATGATDRSPVENEVLADTGAKTQRNPQTVADQPAPSVTDQTNVSTPRVLNAVDSQPGSGEVAGSTTPVLDAARGSEGNVSTGIRAANEETEARRAEKNLPELPGYTAKTSEDVYQEVRDRGESANALNVADDVIRNKRAMTAHEIAANVLKQNEIEAEQDVKYKQIQEAVKAGTPYDALLAEYHGLDAQYEKLTDATKYSGAEQSLAFRIRDHEINRYSRMQVLKRLELARPDEPITEADKSLAAQHAEGIAETQKGLGDVQAKLDTVEAGRDEAASQDAAEKAVEKLKTKAQRAGRTQVRAEVKAQLDAEHDQLRDKFLRATSQTNAVVGLFDPKILPIIRDIAANRVKSGLLSVDALVDHVHGIVTETIPDATKREVRDAISGHGYGSPIPTGTAFGDLKKQMKLLSEIEDIQSKAPRPTRTKVPVSDEVAALQKQKAEALAENRPPRKQTSLDKRMETAKKQLQGTIDDLTRRIAERDFSMKDRSKFILDEEGQRLKAQRDGLQKVYDSLDPNKTPEARSQKAREREAATRLERLTKEFNDMKEANSKGEYGKPNEPARPDTPEEAAMRAKLDAARTERDAMRSAKKEGVPSDPLKSYKNQLANQIADMQGRIDSGLTDRATGGKTKQLDAEAKVLRDMRDQKREDLNRKQKEIDRLIEARKGKSFLDKYAIYHRAAILSRLSTLGKLASAAAQRAIFTPIEEGAGAAMHAVPGYGKIAKMAPHGTPSLAAEAAAVRSLADVKGNMTDAALKFKTGMNSLDARYGMKGAEADADPVNLFTAPQNAHGAIKTPIQRAAFERSMVQQERYELRRGNDINDPAVRTVMEARAYMKSKEAILMQDNLLSTAWHGMVKGLEANPRLGKFGKNSAAVLRGAMPIVKVPSNFVGEAISHTPGVGLIRPAYEIAISKGIENLSPEQADIIVTALKKHAVGTALFALGYFNADKMGGFYHQHGNGMNDIKPNEIRINLFGKEMDVPSTFLHSPQMEVMMMGAAFRQAIETAHNSRSRNPQSPMAEALHRTAFGVAESLPFVDTPKRLLQATEGSAQAGKAAGDTIGSGLIPGFLPDVASQLDRDPQNHMQVRKRPVKGFGDALKTATGVGRFAVPVDSGRRR